ncbi:MAG: hypothetical protein ACK5XT_13595 [Gemmatimonas sp.]|jgi:hypothetical protein|uniref:hypothetical protein n=1 Tax=Gemmatimonas sp. TaxID=1962908 RepID=UPI00391F7CBC
MLSIRLATTAIPHAAPIALPETAPASATVPSVAAYDAPADEPMRQARQALDGGESDLVRREVLIAAALERHAGCVPAEATFGLAHVLSSPSDNRDAAIVLNTLAEAASRAGDANTEARALADAMWRNAQATARIPARVDVPRLEAVVADGRVPAPTRQPVLAPPACAGRWRTVSGRSRRIHGLAR